MADWRFDPDVAVKSWIHPHSRFCIFIDGNNLYHGSKKVLHLQFEENELKKLIDYFCPKFVSRRILYYNVLPVPGRDGIANYNSRKDLFDRFKSKIPNLEIRLGYLQRIIANGCRPISNEKKVDTMMNIDMFCMALDEDYDYAILISGDMDMVPAVKAIKQRFPDKVIYNVAINNMASGELYRLCHKYILINEELAKTKFGFQPMPLSATAPAQNP